jgi:hypothetical protein
MHLLEIATGGAPHHAGALEARRVALFNLLAIARTTFENTYEIDWLSYRIRVTDEALKALGTTN